jgi:redox-sensitive bicupin YhaK (pirin superfamily)
VNLPAAKKWSPPRYQDIRAGDVRLLSSHDGASLVRLIAGDLGGHAGPGLTHTPIVYAHASVAPGARLELPWPREFNALAYVMSGRGTAGVGAVALHEGQLVVFGPGDAVAIAADEQQTARAPRLEILVLGGRPIRETIVFYGPFVMNTREEITQAIADYRAGRMGVIRPTAA